MEVFCLMTTYTRWRSYNKSEYLVSVCKNEKAAIRAANEYVREMNRLSIVWKSDGDFNNKKVEKEDLFGRYIGEDTFDEYIFHTEYYDDGHRKMEHAIYVRKRIVEE